MDMLDIENKDMDMMTQIMTMAINECVSYSRSMVKQIDHAKGVSDNLGDIKTLIFAAMLAYYGTDHIDDVYRAFYNLDFIELSTGIAKLLEDRYFLTKESIAELSKHCPGTFYSVDAFKNQKTQKFKLKRKIYVSTEEDIAVLIKSLAHQVNHAINSINNPILAKQGNCGSRMGLSVEFFAGRETDNFYLEDVINDIQISEILLEVERMGRYDIADKRIKELSTAYIQASEIKPEDDKMMIIIRPLYMNRNFNRVLSNARLNGKLNQVRKEFDTSVLDESFRMLSLSCDVLRGNVGNPTEEEKTDVEATAKQLVKTYLEKNQDWNSKTIE